MLTCVFCGKVMSVKARMVALLTHERFCIKNQKRRTQGYGPSWSKGLTKETDARLMKISLHMKKAHEEGRSTGRAATIEAEQVRREKIRRHAISTKFGGYVPTSGRGKKGWYKGIFCDSSWELAYILYMVEIKGVAVKKNWEKFPYVYKGKQFNYVPDFILPDKTYVEVKGYLTDLVLQKIKQFPGTIELVSQERMAEILKIVTACFGKDYISLYENPGQVAESG